MQSISTSSENSSSPTVSITLGPHLSTTIDYADFLLLKRYHWSARKSHSCWYAVRKETVLGIRRTVFMHRQITGALPGQEVHHGKGGTLDNRRCNLTVTTPRQHHLTHAELRLITIHPLKNNMFTAQLALNSGGTPQSHIQTV